MLAGFSVSNFKSFQNPQTISFIASKTAMHKEHIFSTAGRKILKSALIFGANAGGKSNLIDAVDFSKEIILSGIDSIVLDKNYFRIDSNAYHIPGVFEYRLVTGSIDKLIQFVPEEDIGTFISDISNSDYEHPVILKLKQQFFVFRKDNDGNIIYNKMKLNHGNDEELFDYSDESDGTKRLFDLIPLFFFLNRNHKTILIDEIDRSFHSNLTRRFIELFYQLTKQTSCQLVATTHDSNLLYLDLIRNDELWFIERDENHSSQIYSLNKYKEHFSQEINK